MKIIFGELRAAPHPFPEVRTQEPVQRGERRVNIKRAGELGALMLAYKTPDGLHPDTDVLDVLSIILATGKKSRLYNALTDRGLTTSAFASASRLRDPGLFSVYAFLVPDVTHEVVEDEIKKEISSIKETGVKVEEVLRAKNLLRAQEAFGRDGSYAIAAQLNEAIASGDWRLYAQYMSRIEDITADDIRRVAQTYFARK